MKRFRLLLLSEDVAGLLGIVDDAFKGLRYKLSTNKTLKDAIDRLKKEEVFDVLIADSTTVGDEGIDGLIKAKEQDPNMIVLFLINREGMFLEVDSSMTIPTSPYDSVGWYGKKAMASAYPIVSFHPLCLENGRAAPVRDDLDGRLVVIRIRLIQRLLEDNFEEVEGPRIENSDGIKGLFYCLSSDGISDNRSQMRITFHMSFLSKEGNDFAKQTLVAMQQAKRVLAAGNGIRNDLGNVLVSTEGVRLIPGRDHSQIH